jgi:pyoverdine/dityrosine biosynthesis protein Dit1/alpha-ketoglutarate-dependent taurine dioxygenase
MQPVEINFSLSLRSLLNYAGPTTGKILGDILKYINHYLHFLLPTKTAVPIKVSSDEVLKILRSYSTQEETPFPRPDFEESVRNAMRLGKPLHMVLPAFPFKSPNNIDKVLGTLPDLGEEFALERLEGLCRDLESKYGPTSLSIISDGLVYNDILGIPEENVWRYGNAIREIANKKFPHISFVRLDRLISSKTTEAQSIEEYKQSSKFYRERLIEEHLPKDFDVSVYLKTNPSALLTYCGYIKFLETDLKYEETRQGYSKKAIKRMNEGVAKRMITRGVAFSNAVKRSFPSSIRLSIHASKDVRKLPISLFPDNEFFTTPWHTACAFNLDGSMKLCHSRVLLDDPKYELVYRDGRPSHFQECSNLYKWDRVKIHITPIYPCGILISPKEKDASIQDVDMKKVRALAELNSPILLRGFSGPAGLEDFVSKAREMGPILPWKFGEVLVVKDGGAETGGLNNVLSSEPMPMHFDGLFKTVKVIGEDGNERFVPQPPRFQMFTAVTPSPPDTGLTLISSSRLLFQNLPQPYTSSSLSKLTWSVQTTGFNGTSMSGLDLVIPHPTHYKPCLRYHEPWLQDKTIFDPTIVKIENGEKKILDVLDGLLYDRRVCYYHAWEQGDVLVNDNIAMMHTRSGFRAGCQRELWRVHID